MARLDKAPYTVAFVVNASSERMGRKDIIKIDNTITINLDILGFIDPHITVNIIEIFHTDNLVEYKSPTDYVSVDDFYKVYGYACLYASLNKVAITDLTLTFVESRYPREGD